MSKRFTKIICAILSAVVALGILLVAGCSAGHTDSALSGGSTIFSGDVKSNGGFAVEKGEYIYFINGVASNSAKNDYGTPVKGAISRISKTDYRAHNYSNTDIVVPLIAYSSNHNGGIFVYGDEVYYGTPSTVKNSEGAIQYQYLEMQSTKLDRSKTSAPYIRFDDASYEYRFVEVKDTVYLLYVAEGETLYGESSGVKNIHSLNTKTGENTVLAYNVDTVLFDDEDKTNPQIYYTMNVKNYSSGSNYGYNQIYTVTADTTEAKEYDTSDIIGWTDDDRYINCGTLVFEGIGGKNVDRTPFNYQPKDEKDPAINTKDSYTYKLYTYVNGTLLFTRSNVYNSGEYLYAYKDGAIEKDDATPISLNTALDGKELLKDGSNAGKYKYLFNDDGDIYAVLFAESSGGVSINYVKENGKLHEDSNEYEDLEESKYFNIVKEGTATLLFLDTANKYLYYSASGGTTTNGYSVWRVSYDGTISDYRPIKTEPDKYSPVQILDVDSVTDWYLPEIIDNQLIYASASKDMTLYSYILACDLRKDGTNDLMSNAELRAYKELYDGIKETITDEFGDTDKYPSEKYQNIQKVLNYGFYTADTEYIYEHQKKVNEGISGDDILVISDETIEEYLAFLTPTADGVWGKYTGTKTVNGKTVYATNRNYYYSLLGKMSTSDKSGYENNLISSELPTYTVETKTWWESLSTVEQVFFVIGMVLIGLIVIAGVTVLVIFLVKRKKKGGDAPKRRRIRVDTTDDKSLDVYNN